ncbi:MAG: hypothetical protein LUE12_01725 [Ruminococcus sp.]|nr:hypothetical protein [Ruminococcus sp.]
MKFKLTVKQKLSMSQFGDSQPLTNLSPDGSFEADNIGFARRDSNAHIRAWVEGSGMKLRTQKDWQKNPKSKLLEKEVMVQDGAHPASYIFTLEQC